MKFNCTHASKTQAIFVSHMTPSSSIFGTGSSVAGNQVQLQIKRELELQLGQEHVRCIAMNSIPAWPKGSLIQKTETDSDVEFIGYINLPVIKHISFALRMFCQLMFVRPELVLQYNSYLFENFAILTYRKFQRVSKIAILIQDIHVSAKFSMRIMLSLKSLFERASIWLAKAFDLIIPISDAMIVDFGLPKERSFVFQGGATEFSLRLMSATEGELNNFAVFAGALEPHNGVDRLIKRWLAEDISETLHIFGRGSLDECVRQAANSSSKIVFHGFETESVISSWQQKAQWNICFRYSLGLDQRYFFPSKLFNIVCSPGAVIVNDFHAFPNSLRAHVWVIDEDLKNLSSKLAEARSRWTRDAIDRRHKSVMLNNSWTSCVAKIVSSLARKQANESVS